VSDLTGRRLYDLLPAIYRIRDKEEGDIVRALLSVIEKELQLVEGDIDQLYDNWFVETCAEWVVPYLGDLLGVGGLAPVEAGTFTQRALVANTIGYRRRKGTAAMLEQLARDVSGWPARAVEFFQRLETSQYVNHIRPTNLRTPDFRDANRLELVDGPFENAAHTADVRHVDRGRGKYNIANVGLFLWRLQAYSVGDGDARQIGDPADVWYTFSPLGLDAPLFNPPQTEKEITHLAQEDNVAGELRRRVLFDELEGRRQSLVDGQTPESVYFGDDPVLTVTLDDEPDPVASSEILICHLGDWRHPRKTRPYVRAADAKTVLRKIRVAVDPLLGRLTFPKDVVHSRVQVSYSYGFSGDVGGGPYDRQASLSGAPDVRDATWQVGVTKEASPVPGELVATLGEAVELWNAQPAGSVGVISVMDSATYQENLLGPKLTVVVKSGSRLLLVAANWPATASDPRMPEIKDRAPGKYVPTGVRPHLLGSVSVRGEAGSEGSSAGELIIDGFLIEGKLLVVSGELGGLTISNSTLTPGEGGLAGVASATPGKQNAQLTIRVSRCVLPAIKLPDTFPSLELVDSVLGGEDPGSIALAADGANANVQTSTVLGTARVRTLEAGNSIFRGLVTVARRQTGCVRFSYLPLASRTPRRFKCQPVDYSTADRVFPQFTSDVFGQPGYGQLAGWCPTEISAGAEDEGEMGAFHFLQQQQRIKSLIANLNQYLRFGLEAGVFLVT
jgi:phage tail-like protein